MVKVKENIRKKKGFVPTERAREIRDTAEILRLHGFDATDFRRVRTGYTGTNNKPGDLPALRKPEEDLTVADLVAMELTEIEWDGK